MSHFQPIVAHTVVVWCRICNLSCNLSWHTPSPKAWCGENMIWRSGGRKARNGTTHMSIGTCPCLCDSRTSRTVGGGGHDMRAWHEGMTWGHDMGMQWVPWAWRCPEHALQSSALRSSLLRLHCNQVSFISLQVQRQEERTRRINTKNEHEEWRRRMNMKNEDDKGQDRGWTRSWYPASLWRPQTLARPCTAPCAPASAPPPGPYRGCRLQPSWLHCLFRTSVCSGSLCCLCVRAFIDKYVHIHKYIWSKAYLQYIHINIWKSTYMDMIEYIYIYIYIYTYTYTYIYIYICIYEYMYTYIYVYICMYTWIYTSIYINWINVEIYECMNICIHIYA